MPNRKSQAERRTESRLRIMQAAESLLAEKGYFGASVEEIVQRAGYSQGAFYRHWPTKDRMVMDLIAERAHRQAEILAQQEPTGGPAAIIQALRAEAGDPRLFMEMWLLSLRGHPVAPFLQAHYRAWREQVARTLGSLGVAGSTELAPLLIALFDGLILQQALEPEAVAPERLAASLDGLLTQVLPGEGAR